jgi:hypothetical protein
MTPTELEIFVRLNFPWGSEHEKLYKCVTTRFHPTGKDKITVNHAAQTYEEVLQLIEARRHWRRADLYMALGTQRVASSGMSNDGYPKAERKRTNMVSFNSLFCDVDVGKSGCYNTTADAELALKQFCQASGMPEPTMLVYSGSGGFHCYWCTPDPMPLAEWSRLADALKRCAAAHRFLIDPVCTSDAARILRLPTTYNFKGDQPVPVTLVLPDANQIHCYTTDQLVAALGKYIVVSRTGTGSTAGASAWAQNFMSGIDETKLPKLSIDRIALNCPMTAQTLVDGGVGKSEPEWSNDIYLAAWTEDPVATAHRLSCGHKDYDPIDTDKKLAEKQAAIAAGNLGWPRCATFNHAACATCPLLALGKSPIWFAHQAAPHAQPMQPAYKIDTLIPPEYWRNANDHVFINTAYGPIDVLGYPVLDGGIDAESGELVIKTVVGSKERWGNMSAAKQSPQAICEALTKGTKNGIVVKGDLKITKGFIVAWISHLQHMKRLIQASSFGWAGDNFIFGDEVYTPTGPQSVYRGSNADPKYQPFGELKPWLDSLPLIYGNAPLEVLVASSFAAPLVELSCDYSLVLSLYSHQSGYGKSTAMKIAQAVWGHPRIGMSMLDDTPNATMKKLTDLKNLPIYWDELKTKDQIDKVVQIVFGTAQGRSKARLNRESQPMAVGMATTLFAVASNHGIIHSVIRNTEGTEAGGLRVFEMKAQPLTISAADSEALVIELNGNYGKAGALYADFIVRNKATVKKIVASVGEQLNAACKFHPKERYWQHTMTTIVAGAYLANASGLTSFDVQLIQNYLVTTLAELRNATMSQTYTLASASAGEDVLGEMKADLRGRNLIITNVIPRARQLGKPVPVTADFADPNQLQDVWMQLGKEDGRILARVRPFNDWLMKRHLHPEQILELLEQDYVITKRKATIGAGVQFLDALRNRSECYDFEPKVPVSHNPSSPSASFDSLAH